MIRIWSLGPPTHTVGQSKLFSVLAPQWWNQLPPEARIRVPAYLLKTSKIYLFKEYFK
jgi:hypothetical protein